MRSRPRRGRRSRSCGGAAWRCTCSCAAGGPALVLADVAAQENARLIVVGAGEHSKLARRLLGSVADLVAERSPCNVLIIRPDERS